MGRVTGFGEGLFSAEELAVQSKADAARFVGKIVTYVEGAVGTGLGVRPAAVVGGQEPERTNIFLQA